MSLVAFFHREQELADLDRLIRHASPLLVQVYGRRQIGKTALLRNERVLEHPDIGSVQRRKRRGLNIYLATRLLPTRCRSMQPSCRPPSGTSTLVRECVVDHYNGCHQLLCR